MPWRRRGRRDAGARGGGGGAPGGGHAGRGGRGPLAKAARVRPRGRSGFQLRLLGTVEQSLGSGADPEFTWVCGLTLAPHILMVCVVLELHRWVWTGDAHSELLVIEVMREGTRSGGGECKVREEGRGWRPTLNSCTP